MPISIFRIRLCTEIELVSATTHNLENPVTGFLLGSIFFFVLLGTGSLYLGIRKNYIFMAIPACTVACLGVSYIQFLFILGCSFNSNSTTLLTILWRNEKYVCSRGYFSGAYIKRVTKRLSTISFGRIDTAIKMNYMKVYFKIYLIRCWF